MPLDEAKPFSKSEQLARGPKRPKRLVASKKRWAEIAARKQGPCKGCLAPPPNQLHHVISRAHGGADTEANIIPLCLYCHQKITEHDAEMSRIVVARLDDSEYSYAIEHGGEGFFERAYGLKYVRAAPP